MLPYTTIIRVDALISRTDNPQFFHGGDVKSREKDLQAVRRLLIKQMKAAPVLPEDWDCHVICDEDDLEDTGDGVFFYLGSLKPACMAARAAARDAEQYQFYTSGGYDALPDSEYVGMFQQTLRGPCYHELPDSVEQVLMQLAEAALLAIGLADDGFALPQQSDYQASWRKLPKELDQEAYSWSVCVIRLTTSHALRGGFTDLRPSLPTLHIVPYEPPLLLAAINSRPFPLFWQSTEQLTRFESCPRPQWGKGRVGVLAWLLLPFKLVWNLLGFQLPSLLRGVRYRLVATVVAIAHRIGRLFGLREKEKTTRQ